MANKKVTMLVQISGSRDGKDWPKPGDTLTVPASEAEDLVRQGVAVTGDVHENALADATGVETATTDVTDTKAAAKARARMKPAPHADEPDAYHVPRLPGEEAAAEAGDELVHDANVELAGKAVADDASPRDKGEKK
jgi:hypothetical protein